MLSKNSTIVSETVFSDTIQYSAFRIHIFDRMFRANQHNMGEQDRALPDYEAF